MPHEPVPAPAEEPPAGASGLHTAVAVFGMSMVGMVVATALYGPHENSERAFRLLHWWKRDEETAPDGKKPAARARRQ